MMPVSAAPKTFTSDLRPSRAATIEATVSQLEPVREITQRDGVKTCSPDVLPHM